MLCSLLLFGLEISGMVWDNTDWSNWVSFPCFLNISHTDSLGNLSKLGACGPGTLQLLSRDQKGVKQMFFGVRKLIWNKIFSKHWAQLCI